MTYKIKSLFYLLCFVIAAFIYNGMEQEEELQQKLSSQDFAETDFEDSSALEELDEELPDDLE